VDLFDCVTAAQAKLRAAQPGTTAFNLSIKDGIDSGQVRKARLALEN
jgi:hypothetical protein